MKGGIVLFILPLMLWACEKKEHKPYSVWMAESEMQRNPELWQADFVKAPKWEYTHGLMAKAMLAVNEATGEDRFLQYAQTFADQFVDSAGRIKTYKKELYNLDRINGGKFLWDLWHKTGIEKYRKAAVMLRAQLDEQPRTSEGGFWHKKVYPHQMWLDGLYMGAPFYAQSAHEMNTPENFDDVINQFVIVYSHTYDARTGLNFHGWDESRGQEWANKETGCSPHVWGRAMGWYTMALVDVLDYIPVDHPRREEILKLLQQVAEGVKNAQDPAAKLWYQVMDQPGREGNYHEATSSSMFVYALYKAVRMNYLPADPYLQVAREGYQAIVSRLIKEEEDGNISLTKCCAVAGLGGKPYRDGSYEYYIHETIRDNDPKGVGPFILASLEYERLQTTANE